MPRGADRFQADPLCPEDHPAGDHGGKLGRINKLFDFPGKTNRLAWELKRAKGNGGGIFIGRSAHEEIYGASPKELVTP